MIYGYSSPKALRQCDCCNHIVEGKLQACTVQSQERDILVITRDKAVSEVNRAQPGDNIKTSDCNWAFCGEYYSTVGCRKRTGTGEGNRGIGHWLISMRVTGTWIGQHSATTSVRPGERGRAAVITELNDAWL